MTLNEMIVCALDQMKRGSDSQTIDNYRGRLMQYANIAQQDLARDFPLYHTEDVLIEDGRLDVTKLSRRCVKIEAMWKGADAVRFTSVEKEGRILVASDGLCTVRYRYVPDALENPTDVPAVPEQLHQCIVTYMVACERAQGDPSTQRGATVYFEMYRDQKRALMRGGLGSEESYKIKNMERW